MTPLSLHSVPKDKASSGSAGSLAQCRLASTALKRPAPRRGALARASFLTVRPHALYLGLTLHLRPSSHLNSSVTLRWFGAAGIELRSNGSVLVLDPFFTRPPLRSLVVGRPAPDVSLVAEHIRKCDHVLVTHTHYDHVMDVPAIVRNTGATAHVPPNGYPLLRAHGVAAHQIHVIEPGDEFSLGPFAIVVYEAEHFRLPGVESGTMVRNLKPPLRLRDYRMDVCLSFLIRAEGFRVLRGNARSGPHVPADVFCIGAENEAHHYARMLSLARRPVVIPVHWDDFFRPLSRPLRPRFGPPRAGGRFPRRIDLARFRATIEQVAPQAHVVVPEAFQTYDISSLAATALSG